MTQLRSRRGRIDQPSTLLEAAIAAWLLSAVLHFVILSMHWPLVGDATLLHYCVLLMRHGYTPYRDILV